MKRIIYLLLILIPCVCSAQKIQKTVLDGPIVESNKVSNKVTNYKYAILQLDEASVEKFNTGPFFLLQYSDDDLHSNNYKGPTWGVLLDKKQHDYVNKFQDNGYMFISSDEIVIGILTDTFLVLKFFDRQELIERINDLEYIDSGYNIGLICPVNSNQYQEINRILERAAIVFKK